MRVFVHKIFLVVSILFAAFLFEGVSISFAAITSPSPQLLSDDRRAQLQQQLNDLESQIATQQKIIDATKVQSASLQRDVELLDAKIKEAKLAIKARDLTIQQLSQDISGKEVTIGQLNDKLDTEKESLAQLIRKTQEIDSYSLVEFALSSSNLSSFFADLDSFDSIKEKMHESFAIIGATKDQTVSEKSDLEDKRAEQQDLRGLQVLQQNQIAKQEADKVTLLKQTKGQEKLYQQQLAKKQSDAAAIRTALFSLSGSSAIPFDKALQYATEVGGKLGIRPAFLLGIIAEESNLGENVGTGNWRTDMHPTRDVPIFSQICAALGLDPDKMPVSKKAWYGWGGAMGPAQFIPSTWVLYQDRISGYTGNTPPNPWDTRDAFYASGILLQDNGADGGTLAAERLAALRYLAGWKNATKPAYAFYGDQVADLADKYQQQINIIKGTSN